MATGKHMDRICIAATAIMLALTFLFMGGGTLGLASAERTVKYETTLFDDTYVHRIDIVMDDWDALIETCENEEYATCTVVIDGDQHKNTAIRAKGNTSLSNVRSLGSQRYSFKLEFDHYEEGKSCDGLDKLCLNNLIQDNTMMKDYLVYQMMADFGADAPLCSYAYLTVNGEDWGLYLAVEGIEESFLTRNYGTNTGELYKPDSMSFGGGRGNGRDFDMETFELAEADTLGGDPPAGDGPGSLDGGFLQMPSGEGPQSGMPQTSPGEGPQSGMPQMPSGEGPQNGMPQMPEGDQQGNAPQMPEGGQQGGFPQMPEGDQQGNAPQMPGEMGSRGSDDVKLKYIDDDPDSYANILDNAKTDVTAADRKRLIAALKNLSAYTDLENTLDTEEVLRYFVVHNFVCNGDSYTGQMIHNYYLHEKDGKLGMIPWDYNLAFGGFQGGSAAAVINASIDEPVSGGSVDDRPMVGWIFSDEGYTARYHALFAEFLEKWFTDGVLAAKIESTAQLLRPYVEKDPTKFCTTEEFDTGVAALERFVTLRAEAVSRQLEGNSTPVDTGDLNLSGMGTMNKGRGDARQEGLASFLGNGTPEIGTADGATPAPAPSRTVTAGLRGPGGAGSFAPQTAGTPGALPGATTASPWPLVGLSVAALAVGLVVAMKMKA